MMSPHPGLWTRILRSLRYVAPTIVGILAGVWIGGMRDPSPRQNPASQSSHDDGNGILRLPQHASPKKAVSEAPTDARRQLTAAAHQQKGEEDRHQPCGKAEDQDNGEATRVE